MFHLLKPIPQHVCVFESDRGNQGDGYGLLRCSCGNIKVYAVPQRRHA